MSLFRRPERIGNRLDDIFMFKEPEKDVKRRLHNISLHNVNFYEPGKIQKWTRTFDDPFKERDQVW